MSQTRRLIAALFALLLVAGAGAAIVARSNRKDEERGEREHEVFANAREKFAEGEIERSAPGGEKREEEEAGGEAAELRAAFEQFDNARQAPGIVAPGAYSAAYTSLQGLPTVGGAWKEVTGLKYDADDPDYRDYFSNSSGGSGLVTGRIVSLAVDSAGTVYAAGANGGVFRSTTGGGSWTPIADKLPSLSSGDLAVDGAGGLWYATGESNTGATSYVGTGVYRLASPRSGSFSTADRVGGDELESTTIHHLRFAGGKVYAATSRGVYAHAATGDTGTAWKRIFSPQPQYLPGGDQASAQNASYQNIVNDLAIDPKDAKHLVAAAGWRSGATYNGFYESKDGGTSWAKVNPTGAINANDIGFVTFAYSADGRKLYAINQSVKLINQATGTKAYNTVLDGLYVSTTGNPAGAWSKIADSTKLANSGSALKQAESGKGYGPGVQAWYNQFLVVDPTDANHVFAGLEEVYETKNGGSTWTTPGPYWNFGFSCWNKDVVYPPNGANGGNGCPLTTHSDQHAAAVGTVGGKPWLFVGNDGGAYRRPVDGAANADGHATDWQSLNDGTIDALQYYGVGVGKLNGDDAQRPDISASGEDVLVSGGLQDNGGSLLRPGAAKMVGNFGGDGGRVLVDPADGCNIVQEYVYLSLEVTNTCANPGPGHPNAFLDLSDATTYDIAPPDVNAQFIAPFTASETNAKQWLAGGNSLWYQDKGYAIRSGSEWQKVYTLDTADKTFTSVAFSGDRAIAAWCGPCQNASATTPFARGVVVGTLKNGSWTWKPVALPSSFPNRYLSGAAVDPKDSKHLLLGVNGFTRKWTEGPGAGVGHVFESKDGGATWTDISGTTLPDVPVNDLAITSAGGIVAGTDLGVVERPSGTTAWKRVGSGLPVNVVMDLQTGPDGQLYAATHGRGIWRIPVSGL